MIISTHELDSFVCDAQELFNELREPKVSPSRQNVQTLLQFSSIGVLEASENLFGRCVLIHAEPFSDLIIGLLACEDHRRCGKFLKKVLSIDAISGHEEVVNLLLIPIIQLAPVLLVQKILGILYIRLRQSIYLS